MECNKVIALKRRRSFVAQTVTRRKTMHQWILFVTATLDGTKKTEENLILRIGKSKAEVTNNKRLRWRYCTVEANYIHEASRGLSATAELLVLSVIMNFAIFEDSAITWRTCRLFSVLRLGLYAIIILIPSAKTSCRWENLNGRSSNFVEM